VCHMRRRIRMTLLVLCMRTYEEEDTCVSYEEEDTCVSYEEEDTHDPSGIVHAHNIYFGRT